MLEEVNLEPMAPPAPQAPKNKEAPPERLGRYRLVRPISTGGMARVFEGRRESLAGVSPRVAIKVILPDFATDEGFQRLFVNEARIGSQLQHQNLVQIQDFDRQGEHFYLVMEFVDGVTLRRAIGLSRKHGMLIPVPVIAELGRQVCDGLHYAHTACGEDGHPLHLVHRDIKPSNLILNAQGVVKVLDFGISKALFSRERQGSVKGTWGYMSPEQSTGIDVGPQADVFGLASVLYELATLRPLFPEKEPKDLRAALTADEGAKRAAALAGPAGILASVLVRALQRDPQARFPSALAFQRALGGLMANPVTAREQLVHFWATLMELQGENPTGGAYRSQSLRGHASRASSQASAVSLGTGSQASASMSAPGAVSVGSTPSQAKGLQIAVGRAPPDIDLGEPIEEPRARRRGPAFAGVVATLLALAILVFAGSRVLQGRRVHTGNAATDNTPVNLVTLLGSIDQEQQEDPTPAPRDSETTQPTSKESPTAAETSVSAPAPSVPEARVQPTPPPTPSSRPVEAEQPVSSQEQAAQESASSAQPTEPDDEPDTVAPESSGSATAAEAGGLLTVSSLPRSQVIVDGKFVGWAPMLQHPVPSGSHTITLVADDGRRYTFRVSLEEGEEVRKVWHFDKGTWVEQ